MKNKNKLYSITLASITLILFLILVSFTASPTSGQSVSHTFQETQVTNSGVAVCPSIYNGRIVWRDSRNGNWDIYMYDLSTQREAQITNDSSDQVQPSIYGDRIVWEDHRNEEPNIYMYDLSTHKETQITSSGSAGNPTIYEDKIVWQDNHEKSDENGNYITYSDIYLYNLSTQKEARITSSGAAAYSAIYKDRIVWNDHRNGMYDIYMYDLSTQKETRITGNGSAGYPAIYGNRIVYDDSRNGTQVYIYNLSTQKETRITNSESVGYPAIYGDRIVWQDNHYEKSDENGDYITYSSIYMYGLSTCKETQITNKGTALIPRIDGDVIVWYEYHNGKTDIYMCTLNSTTPVADFSTSPTTGSIPLNIMFTDKSMGAPNAWNWNFGDGNNSTEQNPKHTYSTEGNYTITLTASSANGTDTKTKEIDIQSAPQKIPDGFNFLVFLIMVLYLRKKSI
jgi:beta propeller repeat protein